MMLKISQIYKTMKTAFGFTVSLIIFCAISVNAQVYKWVDDKGKVYYSDKPFQGQAENDESIVKDNKGDFFERLKIEIGSVPLKEIAYGKYHQYIPDITALTNCKILVVNHGMFKDTTTAEAASYDTLKRWKNFSNAHKVILVAPVFDNHNFSVTTKGAGNGGYRGLFGRKVDADVFLHEIIYQYQLANKKCDGRFYLYGHSAGAQFANRYLVRHPHRVIATSFSAPAWFSLPTMQHKWPLGMAPRQYTAYWPGESAGKAIDVRPRLATWIEATQIPIEVVVGELDLEKMRHVPGIGGDTHVDRAKFWVAAMNDLSVQHGNPGKITLNIVPGVGHNYGRLAAVSQKFFARQFEAHPQ